MTAAHVATAIKNSAQRLDLTWDLRPGTVVNGANQNGITLTVDGDAAITTAVSLIGVIPNGSRVFVTRIPPGGLYVTGFANLSTGIHSGETGSTNITFVTQTSFSQAVTFTRVFPSIPKVFTNINSGAGSTGSWNSRAISITALGFTIFVFGPSSSWTNIPVQWAALL